MHKKFKDIFFLLVLAVAMPAQAGWRDYISWSAFCNKVKSTTQKFVASRPMQFVLVSSALCGSYIPIARFQNFCTHYIYHYKRRTAQNALAQKLLENKLDESYFCAQEPDYLLSGSVFDNGEMNAILNSFNDEKKKYLQSLQRQQNGEIDADEYIGKPTKIFDARDITMPDPVTKELRRFRIVFTPTLQNDGTTGVRISLVDPTKKDQERRKSARGKPLHDYTRTKNCLGTVIGTKTNLATIAQDKNIYLSHLPKELVDKLDKYSSGNDRSWDWKKFDPKAVDAVPVNKENVLTYNDERQTMIYDYEAPVQKLPESPLPVKSILKKK